MANIPAVAANPADVLGYDTKVGSDLDPSGRPASGLELVLDAMLHRLQEDTLLLTGAPDDEVPFGINLRRLVGQTQTQEDLDALAPQIEEALRRDPRVATVAVTLSFAQGDDASRFDFLVRVSAVTISGQTIDRIVGVSAITTEFLAQGR